MRSRIYTTEALIVRRHNVGEADRLLVLATPRGKQRVMARGVRKTTSRLAGHIELFTHTTVLLAIGRNLDIVTQSQVQHRFQHLHARLDSLSHAYYLSELYDQFTQEGDDHAALFRLLLQTFAALDSNAHGALIVRFFELQLLHHTGYRPHLYRCPICQDTLTEEASSFSPLLGGVLCPAHAAADRHALPLALPTFKLLRYLQRHSLDALPQINVSDRLQADAERLLRGYIRHILEHDLKTVPFLEALRASDAAAPPYDHAP